MTTRFPKLDIILFLGHRVLKERELETYRGGVGGHVP